MHHTSTQQASAANKRGKPSSRPGQLSRKDLEKRAQLLQEVEQPSTSRTTLTPVSPAEDAVVPEVVTNRMLKRIIMFMGVPVVTGMLLLPGFYYLKVVQGWDVPTYVVYTIQSFTFGAGTLTREYHPCWLQSTPLRLAGHQLWHPVYQLGPAERGQRVGRDRVQGQLAYCARPLSQATVKLD